MRLLLPALVVAWHLAAGQGQAFISSSADCAACHASASQLGSVRPGAMSVLGEGLINLDLMRNDPINRGSLKFFRAHPGDTVALNVRVFDGRDRYAVSITNFEADAVLGPVNSDFLTGFTPDPSWHIDQQFPPSPVFYTSADPGTTWLPGQAPKNYTFQLTLAPNTPPNTYELEFSVAGVRTTLPRFKFVDSEYFYLQVVAFGDLNGDTMIDALDIDLLTTAIRDGSTDMSFDLDGSGAVAAGDVVHLVETILDTSFGDADLNGSVTASGDGAVLLANLGGAQGNKGWADADFGGDQHVTASADGATLLANLGNDTAAVPEPTSVILVALSIVLARLGGHATAWR